MARGFESKDVEFQQAEAERRAVPARALTPEERSATAVRQTLQLTIARVRQDLNAATSDAHRRMLEHALSDLERQLAAPTITG